MCASRRRNAALAKLGNGVDVGVEVVVSDRRLRGSAEQRDEIIPRLRRRLLGGETNHLCLQDLAHLEQLENAIELESNDHGSPVGYALD